MSGYQIEYPITYLPAIVSTMEVLDISSGFKKVMFVRVERPQRRKRSPHADSGQNEVAGTTRTEIEVSRLVEKDVGAAVHSVMFDHIALLLWPERLVGNRGSDLRVFADPFCVL